MATFNDFVEGDIIMVKFKGNNIHILEVVNKDIKNKEIKGITIDCCEIGEDGKEDEGLDFRWVRFNKSNYLEDHIEILEPNILGRF